MSYQYVLPGEIEKRSFEILTKELGDRKLLPENEPVIKRVIHTTADFDYVDNLVFSDGAVTKAVEAFKAGAGIVTDTQMALSGIHKSTLESFGGTARCFMSDPEVARLAKERQTTRAWVSMEEAARLPGRWVFAIGNAPTALMKSWGNHEGYRYAHDWPGAVAPQQYMPDELQGREYYHPNDRGYEHEVKPRLERIRKILHEEDDNGDGRSGQRNA